MQKKQQKAFTLLELLVVIAIIGILISLGVASFSNAQRKARDSRRREDIKSMQNGLEQFYANNNGSYPVGVTVSAIVDAAGTTYFPAGAPVDPKNVSPYTYSAGSAASAYCICARLETSGSGNADAAKTPTTCSYGGTNNFFCVSNLQ